MEKEIILASKSKRRQELLSLIGIKYRVFGTNFDEDSVEYDGRDIEKYVVELAKGKCKEAIPKFDKEIILSADTVVIAKNRILGKPKDIDEAFSFLKTLSDDSHYVVTGLCFYNGKDKSITTDYCKTKVNVQQISDDEIWWYINSDNVLDAAGAYKIQNGFSRYITSIEGSYHNVVGLPVNNVYNRLKQIFESYD